MDENIDNETERLVQDICFEKPAAVKVNMPRSRLDEPYEKDDRHEVKIRPSEDKVIKDLVYKVLKELETKENVAVLEEDLKKEIGLPEDDIFLIQRIRRYIRGSGLSVIAKHDRTHNEGKRIFVFYDTKFRFVVCGINE